MPPPGPLPTTHTSKGRFVIAYLLRQMLSLRFKPTFYAILRQVTMGFCQVRNGSRGAGRECARRGASSWPAPSARSIVPGFRHR